VDKSTDEIERARPPATQTPLLLVRGTERLRFSGPQRRPPTSATHLRRAVTPCVRFVLAREFGLWSRFALPCREVTQTTGSEPRGTLQSPATVSRHREIAATAPDEPSKLRLTSQSSEDRVRREARAKGSPKRAPLLVTPLEHPSYPLTASKGLEAPNAATAGRRPSFNAVPRRQALSERSRCFSPNRNPSTPRRLAPPHCSRTVFSLTPPIHLRDLRALLQRTAPLFSLRGASP